MKSKLIVGALAGALLFGLSASPSHALTFQYSFDGIVGFISGLEDNSAGQAADSVTVTVSPIGGVGEYAPGTSNSFTVSGGAITAEFFFRDTATHRLILSGATGILEEGEETARFGAISFSLVTAETPLPAALPLFLTGLGALGLLGWRRKRKQIA